MVRLSRGHGERDTLAHESVTTPIEVRVSATGAGACAARIGGVPVAAVHGEDIQCTVLEQLRRMALAGGHAVRAMVHDERFGLVLPLAVGPDGSSHLTAEPVAAPPAAAPVRDPGPAVPAPAATLRTPIAGWQPAQEDLTGGARPTPPRGFDAVAESVLGDDCGPVPAGGSVFAEQLAQIKEAVRSGRIDAAGQLAERLHPQASGRLGEDHPEVLRLRELTAYIAYLAGEPARAVRLSLDVAAIHRRRQDAEAAYGTVQSAYTAWRAVRDPREGLSLGGELIELWSALAVQGGPAADGAEQLRSARARMDRLSARAADAG